MSIHQFSKPVEMWCVAASRLHQTFAAECRARGFPFIEVRGFYTMRDTGEQVSEPSIALPFPAWLELYRLRPALFAGQESVLVLGDFVSGSRRKARLWFLDRTKLDEDLGHWGEVWRDAPEPYGLKPGEDCTVNPLTGTIWVCRKDWPLSIQEARDKAVSGFIAGQIGRDDGSADDFREALRLYRDDQRRGALHPV